MKLTKKILRDAAEWVVSATDAHDYGPGCCKALARVTLDQDGYHWGILRDEFCAKFIPGPIAIYGSYWWPDFSEESQNERCLFLLFCAEALNG